MTAEIFEFVLVILLIAGNGYFAMAELAVLSARKLKLRELAEKDKNGNAALDLREDSSQFLSTVQIGITLVGVASGAIGGATLANKLAEWMAGWPLIAPYSESLSVVFVILGISYLSLVFGELVPKQIALSNPEQFAMFVAPVMQWISKWFAPVTKFLSWSTNLITRLVGIDTQAEPEVSVEELRLMIDEGRVLGVLAPKEETMLEQVLRFDDARIEAIITPRPEIKWIDIHFSQDEIKEFLLNVSYDKFPVAETDLDNILGVVYTSDLLSQYLRFGEIDLHAALNPAVFAPEGNDLLDTLELMQKNHTDIIFVLNEYGGVDGMVTGKDMLEVIVGDLPEMDEVYDPKILRRADGSMLLDGMLFIDEFLELTGIEIEIEERARVQTLAGFVIQYLGAIPNTGDTFEVFDYKFEIMDMDNNRIDKILVQKDESE